ncbi:hypothetical protein M9458_006465, partial [Cirrhinus mrigala]
LAVLPLSGLYVQYVHVCNSHPHLLKSCAELTSPALPVSGLALAPSLTPAPQPTISLLSDNDAETLSVDSLTLLPPADPPRLRSFSTQSSIQDDASADGEETATASRKEDDGTGATDTHSQDDRKDISIIPEEDEPSSESGPLHSAETEDLMQIQREEPVSVTVDQEDNPDLEEETAID